MPFGEAGTEKINLNYDDLWTGGPFQVDVSLMVLLIAHVKMLTPVPRNIEEETPIQAW
jgi:hypothetical protein